MSNPSHQEENMNMNIDLEVDGSDVERVDENDSLSLSPVSTETETSNELGCRSDEPDIYERCPSAEPEDDRRPAPPNTNPTLRQIATDPFWSYSHLPDWRQYYSSERTQEVVIDDLDMYGDMTVVQYVTRVLGLQVHCPTCQCVGIDDDEAHCPTCNCSSCA